MKYQVLFSLKINEKVFMNVICCSRDRRFKVNAIHDIKKNILCIYINTTDNAFC